VGAVLRDGRSLVAHCELTNYEWAAIKPMLPNKPRGVPRVSDRCVLNGIFWVLRSWHRWRDLCQLWPYTTCHDGLRADGFASAHATHAPRDFPLTFARQAIELACFTQAANCASSSWSSSWMSR
jgi:transposase